MIRPIHDRSAYYRAVDRAKRPNYNAPPPAPKPAEPAPEPEAVSITWLLITLEHLAEEEALADKPAYHKALAEARKLVAQHTPANHEALAKLALGDTAIRALVEKAGLRVKTSGDIEKVRRLLMVAAASAGGAAP